MAQTEIRFETATVHQCDFIGRTISGICAVVLRDGVEVFRSRPHVKRIGCKLDIQAWEKEQAA